MKMLTKEIEKRLPKLYEQDGKGFDAIVHVKFFDAFGSSVWFVTEYDPEERLCYGWACLNGDLQCAEFGYVGLDELIGLQIAGRSIPRIERDLHFKPVTLRQAIKDRFNYEVTGNVG